MTINRQIFVQLCQIGAVLNRSLVLLFVDYRKYKPSFRLACFRSSGNKKRNVSGKLTRRGQVKEKWLHENWGGLTVRRLESDQTSSAGFFVVSSWLYTTQNERCGGPEIFGWAVSFSRGHINGRWEEIWESCFPYQKHCGFRGIRSENKI